MAKTTRHGGFSLIEVLVAFAILAIALTSILSLFSTGLRNTSVAHEYGQALAVAESRMAAMQGIDGARLMPQINDDVFDERYYWRSEIRLQDEGANEVVGMALYALSVEVSWQAPAGRRRVELATVRLGRAP